jgi:hypothetical protein
MIYAYWIVVAAVFGVCVFLAGMIVGVREARKILEERPSPIHFDQPPFDWEQTYIRPPTGPDLLVLDLQERTRS